MVLLVTTGVYVGAAKCWEFPVIYFHCTVIECPIVVTKEGNYDPAADMLVHVSRQKVKGCGLASRRQ